MDVFSYDLILNSTALEPVTKNKIPYQWGLEYVDYILYRDVTSP